MRDGSKDDANASQGGRHQRAGIRHWTRSALELSVVINERKHTMTDQSNRTARPPWQAPLVSGLVGVAVGAAIGASTGMWWMMGVLGGVFGGVGQMADRSKR